MYERPRRCLGTISSIVPESGADITWMILKPRFAAAAATHAPVEYGSTTATTSRSGWPAYGKSGFAVLSLANAAASSAGAGLTGVSTGAGTKGETLTIEPRREGIFECDCE